MALRVEHELHGRRKGRNVGIGLMLAGFVLLIMLLTFVKVSETDFARAPGTATAPATAGGSN
ncbi:MAG: cytochrome C oxidase assembly protein [Pseudomonadota bacterium]